MKKIWQDPEYREHISQSMKENWQDPEYRENMVQKAKEKWKNPNYREKMSQLMEERWQNSEYREFILQALGQRWQDPKLRAYYSSLMSEAAKLAWASMDEDFLENARKLRDKQPLIRYILNKEAHGEQPNEAETKILKIYYKKMWDYDKDAKATFGALLSNFYQELKRVYELPDNQ